MIKKTLLLLSCLTLCSCTNDFNSGTSLVNSGKVYQNITYSFDIEKHEYLVIIKDKKYYVPPKNYYEIAIDIDTYYTNDMVYNEYFVSSNELLVYYVK